MGKSYYGEKFGKLLVIDNRELLTKDKALCKCDCGNEYEAEVFGLVGGRIKSCGCWYKKCRFNEKYGLFTIIDERYLFTTEKALCRCKCGKEKYVKINSLMTGTIKSCGCLSPNNLNYFGDKFGRLTVIEDKPVKTKERVLCRCECGNLVSVFVNNLKRGHTVSCGCKFEDIKPTDLTGKMFGYLLVLEIFNYKKGKKIMWKCECTNCGNITVVSQSHLKRGQQGCGCLKSVGEEKIAKILRLNNVCFKKNKTFEKCVDKKKLQFDFFILNKNVLIEYDGIQHFQMVNYFGGEISFEQQKIHDAIKDKYCLENNITLVRIPYTEFNNIEQILLDNGIIKGETNART